MYWGAVSMDGNVCLFIMETSVGFCFFVLMDADEDLRFLDDVRLGSGVGGG